MQCVIYKGTKQPDSYLFVEREDDFSRVPDTLLSMFGTLEYVMTLEIHAQLHLARADAGEVMKKLEVEGYYLQLPPLDPISELNLILQANPQA